MTASEDTAARGQDSNGAQSATVGAKVSEKVKEEIQAKKARRLLESGEQAYESDVVREALAEYFDMELSEVEPSG